MTSITIPLKVRVIAYILTLLPFDGLAAWLVADQHLSTAFAALIGLILGAIHTTTGVFALSHLSIPDGSSDVPTLNSITTPLAQVPYDLLPGYTTPATPAPVESTPVAAADPVPPVPTS